MNIKVYYVVHAVMFWPEVGGFCPVFDTLEAARLWRDENAPNTTIMAVDEVVD